jgi:hypothetical protein
MGEDRGRPLGVTIIAILWLIFGLINIYTSFHATSVDFEWLSPMAAKGFSMLHPWFMFAIPVDLILGITTLCIGVIQVVTVFGLWTGKRYSHLFSLLAPIFLLIINVLLVGLYASAPSEVNLSISWGLISFEILANTLWIAIYWRYLGQSHVKTFLGVTKQQ